MKRKLAGVYLRLSKENLKAENSIDAQREIVKKYAKNNDIEIIQEYIDNGYSGMLDSRPELNKMIVDIIRNKINTVIVKDISRLTRNKNKTGWFIEKFFPDNDIRFISVTESIDSGEKYTIDDSIMLRGIANQYYVKDISQKIKANKLAMRRAGKYVESKVPYGYKKISDDKIIIDEKVANNVRKIFKLYINGYTSVEIARFLNTKKIETMSTYMNMKNKSKLWSAEAVNSILNNLFYTGNFNINKYKSNYINKKCNKENDESRWEIYANHHPKIIDISKYKKVQEIKKKKYKKTKEKYEFLLRDKIICGECKRKMQYKKYSTPYFICSMVYKVEKKCNNFNKLVEKDINSIVKETIKKRLKEIRIVERIKEKEKIRIEKETIKLNKQKYNLYEQKCRNEISEEEFSKKYQEINEVKNQKKTENLNYDKLNYIIQNKITNLEISKIVNQIYFFKENYIKIFLKI